jgi:cytochrome bd-type quinol oxidase subunit 2
MKRLLLVFGGLVFTAASFAEERMNIDISPSRSTWYNSPWLWILGVFIFILLLVAIISSAGSNRISNTKVIVTEKENINGNVDSDADLL